MQIQNMIDILFIYNFNDDVVDIEYVPLDVTAYIHCKNLCTRSTYLTSLQITSIFEASQYQF